MAKTFDDERKEFEQTTSKFADSAFPVTVELQYQSKANTSYKSTSKGMSKFEYLVFNIVAHHASVLGRIDSKSGHIDIARLAISLADATIEEIRRHRGDE